MMIAAAVVLLPRPGHADEALEATYLRYQQAIQAEAVCKHRDFDTDDNTRIASYVEGKVHHRVGPDQRLTLIERARLQIDQLVEQKGCDSAEIGDFLTVFVTELAPILAK